MFEIPIWETGTDRQNACREKTRYFPQRKGCGITTPRDVIWKLYDWGLYSS